MKKPPSPKSIPVQQRSDILKLLQNALSKHIKINLCIEPGRCEITQLLLIDPHTSSLLFDRITKVSDEPAFLNYKHLTTSFEFHGSLYEFDVEDLAPIEEEGDVYYSLSIPKLIRCVQRRQHYRVELPPDLKSRIKSQLFNEDEQMGNIVDVSVGGIGAEFKGNKESVFKHSITLPKSSVYIGNELGINTDLVVCFCQYKPRQNRTQVGFKLIQLHPMDEKKIARLIIKLQIMKQGKFQTPTRRIIRHIY